MERLKNGHSIISVLLIAFVALLSPELLAQWTEPPEDAPWFVRTLTYILSQFPDINAWFAASMLFFMSALRAISGFLHFIAAKTETKKDDEIAAWFSKALRWVGAIIGWFGVGSSKK